MLIVFNSKGQSTGFYWNNLNENSNRLEGKLTGEVYRLKPQENKHYFYHDKWYEGSIVLSDGDVFENRRLRYMSFSDKLIAYNIANNSLFIVDKDVISKFYIDSENLKQKFVRLYFDGFIKGNRYFEELYSGGRDLLAYHVIKEKKTEPYKNELGLMSDTEYEKGKVYFMYSESTGFKRVRIIRQPFNSIFPEQKKQIKRLLRKNGISIADELSLIRAVSQLDKAGILD